MIINNVTLYNFSSYAGLTSIDLRTDKGKNVILIGGNNGAGKTSLFTAIKLALYGPQCFRFQSKNHHYTARIRELINRDAFLKEDVRSYVELNISLTSDNREATYRLRREWTVDEQKIVENYSVDRDGTPLSANDLDFFQNYLFTIIPPNLFDFFLFDGEEIGEFFATGHYNQYVRNAVLTLSGYDTFSAIQKFCSSFVDYEANDQEKGRLTEAIIDREREIAEHEEWLRQAEARSLELHALLEKAIDDKEALENNFRKSGGLSQTERATLEAHISECDQIKSENSKKIRGFVEELMPLFIMRKVIEQTATQLEDERAMRQYKMLTTLLSSQNLYEIMTNLTHSGIQDPIMASKALAAGIADKLKPQCDTDTFATIHGLSDEQEQFFTAVQVRTHAFNPNDIITACNNREKAAADYEVAVTQLRQSLPESDVSLFEAKMNSLTKEAERCEAELNLIGERTLEKQAQLEKLQADYQHLRKAMQQVSRNQTAYVYTDRIEEIMKRIISVVSQTKFKEVEELTLQMFSQIIRKDNYIQLVELDSDFSIHLFKKQTYTVGELEQLACNMGVDAVEKRIGNAGKRIVMDALGLHSNAEFTAYFGKRRLKDQLSINSSQSLDLYSRIELNQLSKGEKQVFVLALYWAIIKTSNQSVPFIIDTPFARIDTEHREQISRLFFPGISHQVIVLSTDEEVVGTYYHALQPHLAHQYKLDYAVETGVTSITNGYFEEGSI